MERSQRQADTPSFLDYMFLRAEGWLSLLLWAAITAAIGVTFLSVRLQENERDFAVSASDAYNAVYEKLSINETVLEGFASMLRLSGDSPTIRQYTAEMRRAYPHIYSVGFQQLVYAKDRDVFEASLRSSGKPDFTIKDFSYEDSRQFHAVDHVVSYYPTLYGESGNPDTEMVLGLDMFAVPFLKEALLASIRTGKATATRPFTLAEGGRGYIFFKSLQAHPQFDPDIVSDIESVTVSMAVRTDDLLRFAGEEIPQANLRLRYVDLTGIDVLDEMPAVTATQYPASFGKLSFYKKLFDFGHSFELTITAENGFTWSDISLIGALLVLSGLLGYFYFSNSYKRYTSTLGRERAMQALALERENLELRVLERTGELRSKTEEIRELAGKMVNLQEDDYRFVARELHDEFGQLITAIGINTKLVQNRMTPDSGASELSEETQILVDQLHTAMHSLIARLRPVVLDTFGLEESIRQCVSLFKFELLGIESSIELSGGLDNLSDMHAITVYRCVQELVNNAVKHAEPSCIRIAVLCDAPLITISVSDDGAGMDADLKPKGYGLAGLKERLMALSGEMTITSERGQGCCVEIEFQMEAE